MSRGTMISIIMVLLITVYSRRVVGDHQVDAEDVMTPEQVEECKKEANYTGYYNETTPELKCFLSCSMQKLGIMDKNNGALNVDAFIEMLKDSQADDKEIEELKTRLIMPCVKEVAVNPDICEMAFNYVTCYFKRMMLISFR